MAKYRIDIKAMKASGKAALAAIEVGAVYFYSSFYDKDGAFVKVISKSGKVGRSGWAESVECEVVECVSNDPMFNSNGELRHHWKYFAPGTIHSINATNLYKNRADASHLVKFGPNPMENARKLISALTGLSTEQIAGSSQAKAPLNAAQKAWATRRARANA